MTTRELRQVATGAAAGGIATTIIQLSGAYDFGEGSLWFPATAAIGIITLITYRPRTNRKAHND